MTDTPLANWLRRLRAANPTPDAELLRRSHGGADQAACKFLPHRHAPVALRVCRAITRDPHLAEDAAQPKSPLNQDRAGRAGAGTLTGSP
jgi:hypothetical protein